MVNEVRSGPGGYSYGYGSYYTYGASEGYYADEDGQASTRKEDRPEADGGPVPGAE